MRDRDRGAYCRNVGGRAAWRLAAVAGLVAWTLSAAQPAFSQQLASSNAVFGFEDLSGWQLYTNSASDTTTTLTSVRTQGASAYSIGKAAKLTMLSSATVSSSSAVLATLGVPGAKFAIDVRFPAAGNQGSLRLVLTSASRGLSAVSLGTVSLTSLRADTFQTISFPITDQVRASLAGAKFTDLRFQLVFSVPQGSGDYLVDNLRIRSAQVGPADASTQVPDGYGGSVDFDVTVDPQGQASQEKTFDVGPVQVPDRFHLKAGTTGLTWATLDLGYGSTSLMASCRYDPDPNDPQQRDFVFTSCSGGALPGDIVGAAWARLSFTNGAPPMRLRAQLAMRPLGDQLGTGIIPAMPTFWGDDDTCTPAPVDGQVVSVSASCAAAVAQVDKIVSDYSLAVRQANPGAGWIVPPVPDHAKRHGDGSPQDTGATPATARMAAALAPSAPTHLLSFPNEGHANPGGLFDAYWKVGGGLDYTSFDGTNRTLAHMDAGFSTHAVFLGEDVKVLDVAMWADSDSGQTQPSYLAGAAHAEAHLYLFGLEYPVGGFQSDPSGAFTKTIPVFNQGFDAPPIHIWIFAIKVGVNANAGLDLGGSVTPTSVNLTATPYGTIGAHLWGGIDVIVASGGLDVHVDLLTVKVPLAAQVGWVLDTSLASCSANISGSASGDLTISSGGGHVDLVATFGVWPLEDEESMTLFSWEPLFSQTFTIVDVTVPVAAFRLPTSACTGNTPTASISAPSSDFNPVYGTESYLLTGTAYSNNTSNPLPTPIDCSYFSWSVDNPGDTITGTGCQARILFGNTPHQATITLTVTHQVTDQWGRLLTESATATKVVTVSVFAGVKIVSIEDATTLQVIVPGPTSPQLTAFSGPSTDGYLLTGKYVAPDGTVNPSTGVAYSWSATKGGVTEDLTCTGSFFDSHCVRSGGLLGGYILTKTFWDPASDADPRGLYTVTFTVKDTATDTVIGSASFDADFFTLR